MRIAFRYVRTGMLPGTIGMTPVTLTMNSR